MSFLRKSIIGFLASSKSAAGAGKQSSSFHDNRYQRRRTDSLNLPIEAHWHLPHIEKRKFSFSKMSFRSLQDLMKRIGRTNSLRTILEGTRDPKDEQIVQHLRESLLLDGQLPKEHDDYHTLLRFLRMRGFDLLKAKDMFLKMLKWREDFGVDAIAKDFNFEEYEEVKKCYPHGFHGVDRYGRPLYIERLGLLDLNALLHATTIDRYVKYHIAEQEKTSKLRFLGCSLAAKRHIASTTTIVDVKGVGINNFLKPARELFTEIQRIDSNYYPETLHQLFIVNAGPGFKVLWNVVKAFLEARTLSKIHVLGSKYQSKLFEAVDPSNLPEFLGGNCTCSEYGGCLVKDKGPWNDPEVKSILQEVLDRELKSRCERTLSMALEDIVESEIVILLP